MRNFLIFIFFLLFNNNVFGDLLKPSTLLNPDQVILIQLSALNNNDYPYKNFGIEQTWEFAHPANRKFTGPLENFIKMMYSDSYKNIINHKKHIIHVIKIFEKIAFFYVEIIDINRSRFGFNWIVEKVDIKGEYYNCWMTKSVSTPFKYGDST